MKKIFFVFLFTVYCSLALGVDLKADFSINSEVSSVKEGDLVEATLKVWPLENADTAEFSKLQNTLLFNSFQLIQLQMVEPSANNADVLEVKGIYIVRASKNISSYQLNYKGQIVTIEPPLVKIVPLEKKTQDYFVLDQSLSLSHNLFIVLIIVLLILALVAFLKREKLKVLIKVLKKDPRALALKHFNEKFQKATTREDFEEIYARKNEWLPLLKEQPSAYKEFFNVMNQHQYKPGWNNEELREVKNIFDIIRGSFK